MSKIRIKPLNFSEEELQLFFEYKRARCESNFSITDLKNQKRHAEQMLEIFRPQEFLAYMNIKKGGDFNSIAKAMKISLYTLKKKQEIAIMWLRTALIDRGWLGWETDFICKNCGSSLGKKRANGTCCFICETEQREFDDESTEAEDYPEIIKLQGRSVGVNNELISSINTPDAIKDTNNGGIDERYSDFISINYLFDELSYFNPDFFLLIKRELNLKSKLLKKTKHGRERTSPKKVRRVAVWD